MGDRMSCFEVVSGVPVVAAPEEIDITNAEALESALLEAAAHRPGTLAALLYNRLRLAKEIQLDMWSHFCVRTAALAGGRPQGGITIRTRWVTWPEHTENGASRLGEAGPGSPATAPRALCSVHGPGRS